MENEQRNYNPKEDWLAILFAAICLAVLIIGIITKIENNKIEYDTTEESIICVEPEMALHI